MELDKVTQRFEADATQYLAELNLMINAAGVWRDETLADIAEVQAALNALRGHDIDIKINTDVGGAGGAAGAAAATENLARATDAEADAATKAAAAEVGKAAATKAMADATKDATFSEQEFLDSLISVERMATLRMETDATIIRESERLRVSQEKVAAGAAGIAEEWEKSKAAMQDFTSGASFLRAFDEVMPAFVADMDAASAALAKTGAAAEASGAAAGRAWQPWWLFGNNWKTALHWIVAGSAELAAVAIPAIIALGAGALVMVQGAAEVTARHMYALWQAFEFGGDAAGRTMGDFLGLGHALQDAQDAANPSAYEILGSGINDLKTKFADFASTGLNVAHMLDQFSAKITMDLKGQAGAQLGAFLADMTKDLQGIGQVLGDFGHAFLNVFSDMPGLVHVLLSLLDAASKFALFLSSAPAGMVMFAMGMEETFRWGGLLLGVLTRLVPGGRAMFLAFGEGGGFITRFGAAVKALIIGSGALVTRFGTWVAGLERLGPAAQMAGADIAAMGADMQIAGAEMSTGMIAGVTLIIAAVVGLAVALDRVRNPAQQFIDSINKTVASATSSAAALKALAGGIDEAGVKIAQQEQVLHSYSGAQQAAGGATAGFVTWLQHTIPPLGGAAQGVLNFASKNKTLADTLSMAFPPLASTILAFNHFALGSSEAASKVDQLRAAQMVWAGQMGNIIANARTLGGLLGGGVVAGLTAAAAAGINLNGVWGKTSQGFLLAKQQLQNMETGLGAMRAPAREVGADMEALGVASQLAASKVGQVNQTFDQFISTTTGGMSTLAQFEGALHEMGHDALSSSVGINGAISSISRSAASAGFTLKGFGVKAQQSWQQFAAAVQQGESVLDTMRTALAEGAISQGQYDQAIRATAGSLLPFAAHSKTARAMVSQLAQEAGFPATTSLKTLATQLGVTGNKAKGELVKGVEQAIIKMSNLNQVARNLSAVVSGQLDSAMAAAITKSAGLQGATLNLVNAVHKYGANSPQAAKAQNELNQKMSTADKLTREMTNSLNKGATAAGKLGQSTGKAADETKKHVDALKQQETGLTKGAQALVNQTGKVDASVGPTGRLADHTNDLGNKANSMGGKVATAGGHVQTAGQHANTAAGQHKSLAEQVKAAGDAAGPAGGRMVTLAGQIGRVGTSAFHAAMAVRQLGSAIDNLHSKTVTVNTVTTTSKRAQGGPVAAGLPYIVGEAGQELFVPTQSGTIIPHDQTAGMLAAMAGASAASGSGHVGTAEIHVHAHLDSKEVFNSVKTHTLQYNTRNSGNRTGKLIPS